MSLTNALLRIARAIGRWVLEHLVHRGVVMLLGYMTGKIDDFRRRLGRARNPSVARWLRGRIRRWQRAVRVLRDFEKAMMGLPGHEADVLREAERRGIPVVAPGESISG